MAQRPEFPASNRRRQYDTVSKVLIHQNPEDWLKFSLGIPEAEVIEVLETEQPTVKSNRADSFIRANVRAAGYGVKGGLSYRFSDFERLNI